MAYTFTRTGAQIEEIHNTVEDPKSNAQFSDDIRTIAGEYRGLWPDTGGSANKGDTYQTQVSGTGTGQYFTALQDTTVDPVGDDVNWRVVVSEQWVADNFSNTNLLSNHNFLIQTPDDSQPLPSATPTSYPPGYQIFSGVFANETTGISNLTYINGRVSFSGGDLYFAVPNTGAIARLTSDQLVASVADFDGNPRSRGVSFSLVGGEYRVTVGIDALSDGVDETLLGSVKFEQGKVATGHEVQLADPEPNDGLIYDEAGIIAAREKYNNTGVKSKVSDVDIEFSQGLDYPVDHLFGSGRLLWGGRYFDIGAASGYKDIKTIGEISANMITGEVSIGCIGDSTTDGYPVQGFTDNPFTIDPADGTKIPTANSDHSNDGGLNAWPTKMRTLIRRYHNKLGEDIQVFNGGYGGQKITFVNDTCWPYKYFEKIFFDNPFYGEMDCCFISFGLNSSISSSTDTIENIRKGFELLIYKIKGYGITPILLTTDAVLSENYKMKAGEAANPLILSLAKKHNIDVIDAWEEERRFWTESSNGYKWFDQQPDRLHMKDDGHQFKAGLLGKTFMPRVVSVSKDVHSVFYNEREAHDAFGSTIPIDTDGDSRFGGITRFNPVNDITTATWIWVDSPDYDLVMRDFGIEYGTPPTQLVDTPKVQVLNSVGYDDGPYLEVHNSYGGRTAEYVFPTEQPNVVGKLNYGLNRVETYNPLASTVVNGYMGYLQVVKDTRHKYGKLYQQVGTKRERVTLPPKFWHWSLLEDGSVPAYRPEGENWTERNIVNFGNALDVVDLYLEITMSDQVGLPICDGQTATGRGGLVLFQTATNVELCEYRRLDSGQMLIDNLGVAYTVAANTTHKIHVRLEATGNGVDQVLEVYSDWTITTPSLRVQRSTARPNDGAYRSCGVIGGLWSGTGAPTSDVSVELSKCIILK